MGTRFLSEEWVAKATEMTQADPVCTESLKGLTLTVQNHVEEAPTGTIHYFIDIQNGVVTTGLGELDSPEVDITMPYSVAKTIGEGELTAQVAFMTKKIKVTGNMTKLMQNIIGYNNYERALADLYADAEY